MAYNIFSIIIAVISFAWKILSLAKAVKEKNKGKIKADLFFLFLMILVVIGVIAFENWYTDK